MKVKTILLMIALFLAILAAAGVPTYGVNLLAASFACFLGSLLADG
jgi:hypothetical protein